ncbi:hypothetical protein [Caproicibacter sp. BJN0012]|uniref:hypothetical protein n=1 Tax=Caproicibacter sp. BJN0012 TaxID=3110227 RepID=UPI002E0F4192
MKKKIISALVCAMFLVSAAVPAFATTGQFSFSLDPNENSGVAYSSNQTKDDNENQAYVTPTSGNVISSDLLYFAVATSGHSRVTGYAGGSGVQYNVTYHPQYNSGENVPGRILCLLGDTDRYTVSVAGRWTP